MTAARNPARHLTARAIAQPLTHSEFCELDDRAFLAAMIGRYSPEPWREATTLLSRFGGLAAVVTADDGELARATVTGSNLVFELKMLRELAVRLARADACRRPVITSWSALVTYARATLAHEPREQFRALFLDKKNQLMQDELTAHGTVDHAPVYPREVVRRALELSASSIILLHNHPSGDPEPSRADIEMTRKIVEAAKVFDIQVHDHLVVGRNGTASLRTLGLMS